MVKGLFWRANEGHLYLSISGPLEGRRVWLGVYPFGEEMNRSRAIIAAQARAFTERGEAAVLVDLFGCGDSEGELQAATVPLWLDDLRLLYQWLIDQGASSVSLWGTRFGALLAVALISRVQADELLLWKPVLSGELQMKQWFRIRQMADEFKGLKRVNWLERVQRGESAEVAGYSMSPDLVNGICELRLAPPGSLKLTRLAWIEPGGESISPLAARAFGEWQSDFASQLAVASPQFWLNPDCYKADELIETSLQCTQSLTSPADVC